MSSNTSNERMTDESTSETDGAADDAIIETDINVGTGSSRATERAETIVRADGLDVY